MKEFRTPRFGNTPNQSPLKASLRPLDDNQSVSVSCKETDTQIRIPDFSCWAGACPARVFWIPLEGQASGTGARISGRRCAGGCPASCTCCTSY